jgi:hypothetical protein
MSKLDKVPKDHENYDLWEYLTMERRRHRKPKTYSEKRAQSKKVRLNYLDTKYNQA